MTKRQKNFAPRGLFGGTAALAAIAALVLLGHAQAQPKMSCDAAAFTRARPAEHPYRLGFERARRPARAVRTAFYAGR